MSKRCLTVPYSVVITFCVGQKQIYTNIGSSLCFKSKLDLGTEVLNLVVTSIEICFHLSPAVRDIQHAMCTQ